MLNAKVTKEAIDQVLHSFHKAKKKYRSKWLDYKIYNLIDEDLVNTEQ